MTGLVLLAAYTIWGLIYSGKDLFIGIAGVISDEIKGRKGR